MMSFIFKGYSQETKYYQKAYNSQGDSLKARLHRIIDNHIQYPYTSSSTDVWDILKETDKDPNDENCVKLIYTKKAVNASQEYNSGKGWSREHVWAKSRGDFGTSLGAGTDVHHLVPCDISINSIRNNRNFDYCINCIELIDDGIQTGSKCDANLWIFEPPNEVKGNIARMLFYMAVRYEGDEGEPDLELTNTLQDKSSKKPVQAVLNTLLDWHRADTVSSFERRRNEVIFDYQGNRNPFIDHPELAEFIWGDSIKYSWMPNVTVGVDVAQLDHSVIIYPNPNSDVIHIKSKDRINQIEFLDLNGVSVLTYVLKGGRNEVSLNVNKLSGMFYVVISKQDRSMITKKMILR